jgi:hypothetical protein
LRVTGAHAGGGVREMKVRSLRVEELFNFVGPDHVSEKSGWTALVAGELLVEPGDVPEVVAAMNEVGYRSPTSAGTSTLTLRPAPNVQCGVWRSPTRRMPPTILSWLLVRP